MPDLDEIVTLGINGKSTDQILTDMKDHGLTITEAMKASMRVFGIGLGEAKSLVSSHPAWSPVVQASRPFQDDLLRALEEGAKKKTHSQSIDDITQ